MLKRALTIHQESSVFLFGPRQTGKSTWLRQFLSASEVLYYNLLDPLTYRRLIDNETLVQEEITSRHPQISHVIVDEIQKLPSLLDTVHYCMEEIPNPPKFILSGSSARKLKRGEANLLGGRALTRHMYPLTQREFLEDPVYKNQFSLQKFLERGGLPKIYFANNPEIARELLLAYVDTYLREEILQEAIVRNIQAFSKFLSLAAEENTNVLNFSNISKDTGVAASTIKDYYQILEDTLLGFRLETFSRTIRASVVRNPKFYFFDLGVVRAISKEIYLDLVPGTKAYGKAFEQFVIQEIIYNSRYRNLGYEFSYYRTYDGVEVDLIIRKPNQEIIAIEIKSSLSVQIKELSGLKSFGELLPQAKLCCICRAANPYTLDSKIQVLPYQQLYALLD